MGWPVCQVLGDMEWLAGSAHARSVSGVKLGCDDDAAAAFSAKGLDSLISWGSVPCGGANVRAADLE